MVVGEHVPDRLGEATREIDLRDLGTALAADAPLELLVALCVERVSAGDGGGVDQRPPEVPRPVLGKAAAEIELAGLVHPWAQAGV